MTVTYRTEPSKKAKVILDALQKAVIKELDRKRKLGHYAVFWDGEKPLFVGDDAPFRDE
ncbi:hypothetical protein [Acanthopleuribacter pedis]|uniref:Uncharacterized protein n=1 Tax=Acanthopleuribacter pedis TaxID=442870 RepID=A0A8J7QF03_9BACT|nr:hypothetical protein [Acanthopleuribacter pedis]MBO1322804.1 hypothetical protein [Acanthopleuribacter pedis]